MKRICCSKLHLTWTRRWILQVSLARTRVVLLKLKGHLPLGDLPTLFYLPLSFRCLSSLITFRYHSRGWYVGPLFSTMFFRPPLLPFILVWVFPNSTILSILPLRKGGFWAALCDYHQTMHHKLLDLCGGYIQDATLAVVPKHVTEEQSLLPGLFLLPMEPSQTVEAGQDPSSLQGMQCAALAVCMMYPNKRTYPDRTRAMWFTRSPFWGFVLLHLFAFFSFLDVIRRLMRLSRPWWKEWAGYANHVSSLESTRCSCNRSATRYRNCTLLDLDRRLWQQ